MRTHDFRSPANGPWGWTRSLPRWIPACARALDSLLMALLIALLALAGGCASGPKPAPGNDLPGYQQLREEFGPRDFAPLRGRRVVLDPGHGGIFRGALGPAGLAEADVNLGVALQLRGLLEWAGAQVTLTRTADYDFLAGTDSTLAADLAFRVSLTNSLQPDVFISIHHNSTAARDETINETQTYYPLDDEGASLDLARSIHRHLVRNLEISPARILPGNFHVLRNTTVPSVLGEPAMISHPVMEHRLSLAAGQKLEAQAYFLGLLDYFAAGMPAWSGAPVDTLLLLDPDQLPLVRWSFLPDGNPLPSESTAAPGPGPDPDSFTLTRDGSAEAFHLAADGYSVIWQPAAGPLRRPVALSLAGRNLAGRATPPRRTLVLPPTGTRIGLRALASGPGDPPGPLLIHWISVSGLPVPPGLLTLGGQAPIRTAGGSQGWLAIEADRLPSDFQEARFQADGSDEALAVPAPIDTLAAPYQWRLLDGTAAGVDLVDRLPNRPWRFRLLPGAGVVPSCLPDPAAPAVPVHRQEPTWITAPGFLPLVSFGTNQPEGVGTVPAQAAAWPLIPLLPAVMGKVILLDPAGGESSPQGLGPLGLSGAEINLAVARYAAQYLIGAGAEVHLTRNDGTLPPLPDKVRLAERLGADLFLTIGRTTVAGRTTAAHHPGSRTGEAWANGFLKAWVPLAGAADTLRALPSWAYLLRHTAFPALELGLPGPLTSADEIRLGAAAWQRAEARAILLSVAAALGQEQALESTILPPRIAASLDTGLSPAEIDWMELDGNFLWPGHGALPLPLPGKAPLPSRAENPLSSDGGPGLPAVGARHTLEIHAGPRWQLWLLDRGEAGWSSRLLLQGP